ncbi:EpsG family protein [Flavobacterium granuli]|uniref:EpsG family protein n=1 Tax=Flavobacterium granuli TaxID=280093 RepID=A0ABU1S5T5_9FLAO|nr:EpsG family protein [Flavobacterium granuli]MDR6846397.1 hypothetical protein [Flavobacterium granuli]
MIYFFVLFSLVFSSILFDFNVSKKQFDKLYWFYLLVFILIAGLRWKVGGDSLSYERSFENEIPDLHEISFEFISTFQWEPLFVLLVSLCKTIMNEFWFFQLVHAFFLNITLFVFIKKYASKKYVALIIYSFFFYFYLDFEILRESIAIMVFVLIYPYFSKRNWLKYYTFVSIAILFHYSALVLLFFPLFRNSKINGKGILILSVIAMFLFILSSIFPIELIMLLLGDFASNKFEAYSGVGVNIVGVIYTFVVFVIFPYCIYMYNKRYAQVSLFDDLIYIYFSLSLVFIVIAGLGRFLNYLAPFVIVYVANTFDLMFNNIKKSLKRILNSNGNLSSDRIISRMVVLINVLVFSLFLFIPVYHKVKYYFRSTDNLIKGTHAYNVYYPYYSIFDKEMTIDREGLVDENLRESFNNALNNK